MQVRVSALDERGDLAATPGSHPWAVAMRREIQGALKEARSSSDYLQGLLRAMEKHEGYRELNNHNDRPFASYEAFCTEKYPWGLGYQRADIDRIVAERRDKEVKERAEQAQPPAPNGRPKKGVDTTPLPKGAHSDRLAARIARDRPDILERMKAGEFTSVRKAALEAGIVKPEFAVPLEPKAAAKRIVNRIKGEELLVLIRELANWAGVEIREGQG